MSSLPQQTRFRLNVSASHVVVLFGLLLMKFATSAPAPATSTSAVTLSSTTVSPVSAPVDSTILLFEDSEFKGVRSRLHVGHSTCVNLIGKLNDFFSSVDAMDGCYLLCEHQNCRGKCTHVTGKVAHLSRLDLNDKVSSLRICNDDTKVTSSSGSRRDAPSENKNRAHSSSSSSSVFLRRRFKRSFRSSKEEERELPSSFSSNLRQWRTMNRRGKAAGDHYRTSRSDHSVTTSFPPTPPLSSSLTNLAEIQRTRKRRSVSAADEEGDSSVILNKSLYNLEVERNPLLRVLRIRRHRRKRRGFLVRK